MPKPLKKYGQPSNRVCPFRKHKGKPWTEVVKEDPEYVEWLVSFDCTVQIERSLYEYLVFILEEHCDA